MISNLHDFLAPNSIAIIGASTDPIKRGYRAILGLINDGYAGQIYPINPKQSEILGLKTYASVADVPVPIDLALICTPPQTIPVILEQCGINGVKGVIILANGFSEEGGDGVQREQALLLAAQKAGVRVVGPNTSGMFNLHKNINLLALDNVKRGNIGIISQSGNMLLALTLEAQAKGDIGFSTYVGVGNQMDIGFAEYLQYLGEDENTKVGIFHVEGFNDGRAFIEVAKQVTKIKPIVVYKSGSTDAGQKTASSHTGALAGSYRMTVDVLNQVGVTVVERSDEILAVAQGLELLQQANGNRVAVLADGGGQATIAADRISEAGLELAQLTQITRAALRKALIPQASLANPIDVAGASDDNPQILVDCLAILMSDENVDMVLMVGMFGGYAARFGQALMALELSTADEIVELSKIIEKPIVVCSLYAQIPCVPLRKLSDGGVPVYASIEQSVQLIAALAKRGETVQSAMIEYPATVIKISAVTILKYAQESNRDLLEYEARALLRDYGVPVASEIIVCEEADFAKVINEFAEMPLAMKVVSKDILHKSDAGGVELNVIGEAALHEAYTRIMVACKRYNAAADIEGVLVTPMARQGVEVIIGMSRDPIFGPVLMFGLGGVFVEILEDVAFRAIPLNRHDAYTMIDQIKAHKVLDGARGAAAVDKEALVELLLTLSSIVEAHPEIVELDLNPVIAYEDGYAIVDARIIVERAESV